MDAKPAIPAVSLLLPVYRAESTLRACLDSMLRQRSVDWECVAVDDGSDDASPTILRDYATGDERFRVFTKPHGGIVAALNLGLAECRGRFVARMDADDWMHRDRLALQVAMLRDAPELAGVGCRVRIFPRDPMAEGRRAYERWLNAIGDAASVRRESFIECPVAHPTLMLRREVFQRFPYRECGWPEDYDLMLRLLGEGHELAIHPRRLVGWRDGADRLSRRSATYDIDRFIACKAEHLVRGFLANTNHYTLWGYGRTGRMLRRALLRHDRSPAHIVELHPRRIGQTIHGAPVLAPDTLPSLPRSPLLVSVSGAGPRAEIRGALDDMGFVETKDFICTA